MNETLKAEKLNPKFKYEVMKEKGGEKIVNCFSCNTCTLSCPVRNNDDTYNPRTIIRLVLIGAEEEVLSSPFIWLCSACYLCYERCPQDVGITELMDAIKNIAVRKGYIPNSFKGQIDLLDKHGRLYEIGDFENKKRVKLSLPEIKERQDEVSKLLGSTGISIYIKKQEEKNE
jgi:heterodisulfide reductase subunit C2